MRNKVIKKNKDLISFYVYHNFNESISNSLFPTPEKCLDVRPTYKKDYKTDKTNCRSNSIVPNKHKVAGRTREGHVTFVKNHASSFTKIRSRQIVNVKGRFLSFETY